MRRAVSRWRGSRTGQMVRSCVRHAEGVVPMRLVKARVNAAGRWYPQRSATPAMGMAESARWAMALSMRARVSHVVRLKPRSDLQRRWNVRSARPAVRAASGSPTGRSSRWESQSSAVRRRGSAGRGSWTGGVAAIHVGTSPRSATARCWETEPDVDHALGERARLQMEQKAAEQDAKREQDALNREAKQYTAALKRCKKAVGVDAELLTVAQELKTLLETERAQDKERPM